MLGNINYCQLCKCLVPNEVDKSWKQHMQTPEHQQKAQEYLRNKKREESRQ